MSPLIENLQDNIIYSVKENKKIKKRKKGGDGSF
jgi:hypothetical protein